MRQVLGHKGAVAFGALTVALLGILTPSLAEDSAQNAGFSLPGVTLPSGTDEVRAADGTSCRSAVGGNGAYLDVGVIGKQSARDDNAYYGRVVVPLGKMPKRLNCSALYELEIERLKLELELAKAGLGRTQDAEVDSTETSALDEQSLVEEPAAEEAAAVAPTPEKSSKKKKAAEVVEAVAEEPAAAQPAEKKKAGKKKVGKANWDTEGWSTDGFNGGAG